MGADSLVCLGDSVRIGIGYSWDNEIVLENPLTAISHPGRVFLPDGVPCGALGCSYRSPVTFSGFAPGATITSVNDINYVRVNMEHSWIADIYIGITCPNGQRASLMNYSNNGSSSCSSSIPPQHQGWSTGANVSGNTFLGQAYDNWGYGDNCDSLSAENQPGIGWNYCWSNNTTQGYSYAHATSADDGIIYRQGHAHNGIIDSSNVAAGTNFYHPNQNFSALIGCPLNGNWYIEVMDGWSGDNGYIFDWEMSLDESVVSMAEVITNIDIIGDESTKLSDSLFLVSVPAGTTHDTTVTYTVVIHSSTGTDVDTTVTVHYEASPHMLIQDTLCIGDTLWVDTMAITSTLQGTDTVYRESGCAVVRDFNVLFFPSYEFYDTAVFCYGEEFVWHDRLFPSAGDYDLAWQTAAGCDSVWHVTLQGRDMGFVATPLISDDGDTWSRDTMLAGCRPMTVWMQSRTPHAAHNWWNLGDTTWFESDSMTYDFDSVGKYTLTYITESENGCFDTAILQDAVWVYGKPESGFIWTPENPSLSHPTAQFFAQSAPYEEGTFGGQFPLSYKWTIQTSNGYDSVMGESPVYDWGEEGDNVFGDFTVVLTSIQNYIGPYGDTARCEDTASVTVTIVNDWLQFPNLVSPNGDGINDIWKVVNLLECGLYAMNELWVYNHWGTLVYHKQNIADEDDFWNPEETNSPDGTYFFRFSAKSCFGIVRTNGSIEVAR